MAPCGVNIPHAELYADAARDLGAAWVRVVLVPAMDPPDLVRRYREAGLAVLAVLARESFPDDRWADHAAAYARAHGAAVAAWQIGNEPDHASPSSWTLSQAEYARLVREAGGGVRRVLPDAELVGAGMASGQPAYCDHPDLIAWLDAWGLHPYGQDADTCRAPSGNFGLASELIGRYHAVAQKPVWVTEYGSDSLDLEWVGRYVEALTAQFAADPRVPLAVHFCLSDRMVPHFGLLDTALQPKPAAYGFRRAAEGAAMPPWQDPAWDYEVGEGVGYAMQARGDHPVGAEVYLPDGLTSITPGDRYLYTYSKPGNRTYCQLEVNQPGSGK